MPTTKKITAAAEIPHLEIKLSRPLRSQKKRSFPIVAIGGSAGSFKAFEKFFNHMPPDSGMCFIIIIHLDPNHSGDVCQVFQKYTRMSVRVAEDGLAIRPNLVYVIPPDKDMGMHNGRLLLFPAAMPKGYRLPIDHFFQSLAEDQWNKVVGIIFSGMGSDGETGLRIIKEKLGMAMVQDPETAEYDSMPRAAIDTNIADYVLSPEEMPVKLIQYLNHPILAGEMSDRAVAEHRSANTIQKILMLLRSQAGHDFSQYKKNTIIRRIDRRIAFHQLADYGQYVDFLRENPNEIDILFHELLIGVTKFFRDGPAFEALQEQLFNMLRQKPSGTPIRVWCAGCSTGEEAYSIAIILTEYLSTLNLKRIPKVQIFATDIDMEAIEIARAGVYHENIIADVSEDRIEKYFVKKDSHFSAKKELREMIVFAQHNIISDAPFTRLDLLICRNLMIYLTADLQKKIVPVFHYSLNTKGIYFMGPAETLGGFSDVFTSLDSKWKIFERNEGPSIVGKADFPFNVARKHAMPVPEHQQKLQKTVTLAEAFNQVLIDNYTPPSVLINTKGEIVYINGRINKFLELTPGEAVMDINRMAREEFKYALGNAIHQVRSQKLPITISNIKVEGEAGVYLLNIQVTLFEKTALQGLILVTFEDIGPIKKVRGKIHNTPDNPIAGELEKELEYTKQQLHSTIEQMETSLEELKSANEELQSTNEELQSTNEEALTTKEEMQSLNEELMTINMQYHAKTEELTQLNNDMKNMLDNTETGTVFLNNKLEILRYTPQIRKLFSLIPTDVGRSITDIASTFTLATIEEEIRQVIETLVIKDFDVPTKNGEWYNMRIIPYRTMDNFINGAVLTVTRVTDLKAIKKQLEAIEAALSMLINDVQDAALVLDDQQVVRAVNKAFIQRFRLKKQDIAEEPLLKFIHSHWKTSKLDKLLKNPLKKAVTVGLKHDFPGIGIMQLSVEARPVPDKTEHQNWAILTITEG